jgi:putative flavoprotein involved in K+ transport
MRSLSGSGHWGAVVIGGGQAGLAVGRELGRLGEEFLILEAGDRVGDAWRRRWDTLSLFTPAQHDGLPGLSFPASRGTFPTKDEMAEYLVRYAAKFELPVRCGVKVERLDRSAEGFELTTSVGAFSADRVVLATGPHANPRVPEFARDLAQSIHQLHSSGYRSTAALPPGDVLVVGSGTSGVELAIEIAGHRRTSIAGRPTPHIPDGLLRYAGDLYWWLIHNLLTVRTPMGRRARPGIRRGGAPLIRVSVKDLEDAGVERVPRVTGVSEGRPRLADGRVLQVSTVIWATGYRPDFGWITFPIADESGWPEGSRGVSSLAPGLFFVGMPFQFGLTSALVGGVGRDAAFVAERIARHRGSPRSAPPVT